MKVEKKELPKSQLELVVELNWEEFEPYSVKGANKVSKEVKIEGFRPGKVPYNVLKQKIGEMTILEEGARIAINKTLDQVIKENVEGQPVGQPQINITKLAPNNSMEYKVTLAMLPQVTLGDYKAAKVQQKKTEVKDEDINKTLTEIQEMRAQEVLVERGAREGDKLLVDIQMFLDKVPIEGGQGKETTVIIGKDYIVLGFDKYLIGAKKGDTKEFSLPYPKDHHMKNIAGKMVEFKVDVKEVYERKMPKIDDELAKSFGLKNDNELKDKIKKSIETQKERETTQAAEREMLEKILEKTKFGDIPEMLVDSEAKTMIAELEQSIDQQGGKFDDYLASINKTLDQLTLDLLPDAVKRVKTSLLIREIANKENISVQADEIDKNIKEMEKYYQNNNEVKERVNTPEYRSYIYNILSSRKVIEKLREWNVEIQK